MTRNQMLRRLNRLHKDKEAFEAICDRCGMCCQYQEQSNGRWHNTGIACRLLDVGTCSCRAYDNRHSANPQCFDTTPEFLVDNAASFPATCSYLTFARGEPLPWWHHQISGSHDTVHEAGISARGKLRSETWVRFVHERNKCI